MITYTPQIYKKGDWNTHIGMFIAIQALPVILAWLFGFTVLDVVTSIAYQILTAANVGVLVLAVVENRKK